MRTRPAFFYKQSAVIPYRVRDARVEVMLVTSRKGARWIIPKGIVDLGKTPEESALKEAYEEAGLRGEACAEAIGEYEYEKWGGTCKVKVYLMRVTEVLESWPESSTRQRRWLDVESAAAEVREERLKELLLSVPRSLAQLKLL